MSERTKRLARLGAAQEGMAKLIETRLAAVERRIAVLGAAHAELAALAQTGSQLQLGFLPSLLRRLAATEAETAAAQQDADALRHALLAMRHRGRAFAERADALREIDMRKAEEEEALETALAMAAKACRKQGAVN